MSFFSVDLSPFLIKIWDATAGELKHLRRPKPRIEELNEAITKLSAKEEDINNSINLAQLEREIPTSQIQLWLREVEELKDKAAETKQDFEGRRCLGGWSWNCISVNRRVAKKMEEIDKLMTQSDATPVSMRPAPSAVVEIPISDSTFGMEAYKSEILRYITSPNAIEVIGIYGMGGADNTTLLKSINNDRDIATKFDHVIWAVASKEYKIEKLQKDIAKWLGLHLKHDDSTDRCAAELYAFLKNKDCLLLLDDMWKRVDLAMLGMVNASSGHEEQKRKVVVFTTRYALVCDAMNTSRMIQVSRERGGRDLVPLPVEQIPTSLSKDKVGIEECMAMILYHISSANAMVIGVYGMAGIGKTTLLRSIKNHKDVYTKFDLVILGVATKECKIERLQMDISKGLICPLQEDNTEKDRSTMLFDFMEDQDCLLLLDDLWAPLDLTKLGMTHATPRQRKQKRKVVVFTTRNKHVCSDMNADMMIEIKCLEPEQAWKLFRRNAGEDSIRSDARIEHMVHKIAEECVGLPLALSIIGKAMSTKKSSEAWNKALTQMKQLQVPEITSEKEVGPLFSASKISYDSLPDDDMRARLLSCALWPGYHSIKKYELIECWMVLGLINVEGMIHEVYNRGHYHIEILKAAFLLEPGNDEEREVKMNGVIRDMTLWVVPDKFKWIVRESRRLEEEGWHKAERVSLMYNDIASLPN